MRRCTFPLLSALTVAAILGMTVPASTNWGRYYYAPGYYGSYYPSYYGGYYPSYGYSSYYPSYGSAYYPAYGYRTYYSGWYPSYGYYPGYAGYYPSYGSSPTYSYTPSGYAYSTPYTYTTPDVIDPGIARAASATTSRSLYNAPPAEDNTARVQMLVPADAKIWVDGYLTRLTGKTRVFTTPALDPKKTYMYEVKAKWMMDTGPIEQTRTVRVRANQTTTVDFGKVAERDR